MIKYAITLLFSLSLLNAQGQENTVKQGDIFEIGKSVTNSYKHINFPRANFIIKKGGIANYKGVEGLKVIVTSVNTKKDGSTLVKIKRADGNRFFGSHNQVSVNVKEALASNELELL